MIRILQLQIHLSIDATGDRLQRIFTRADLDGNGVLDFNEFFNYGWPQVLPPIPPC